MDLINELINLIENRTGQDLNELLMNMVNNNLDNERMDYQEQIHLRDREIKQLKLALLAANTDPNIVQDSDISESIEPKGATTGGLTPHLAMFNPNTLIVLASDSEGNSMSPMDGRLTVASYQPYTSYDGQLVDDDEAVNAVPCLVLWPKR